MKIKNKGKVHPSSSSSPFPAAGAGDSLAVLNLLPTAILSLAVVLSVDDRQVLAYMITHSIKSTNPNSKKASHTHNHKSPVFDCDCFDCYTSYWFKWDTSPNRELIHQAIEAFEENLNSNEQGKKKGKKKEKAVQTQTQTQTRRRLAGKAFSPTRNDDDDVEKNVNVIEPATKYEVGLTEMEKGDSVGCSGGDLDAPVTETAATVATVSQQNRGLGKKVLPDVTGLFNWRLWSIWSPNV